MSGLPVEPLYTPDDLAGWRYEDRLGLPGRVPVHARRLPDACTAAGCGRCGSSPASARPEDTNARFKFLLAQGQTGLSTAFDMPTLMGYDADHPRALGEVGREGVVGLDARRHGARCSTASRSTGSPRR